MQPFPERFPKAEGKAESEIDFAHLVRSPISPYSGNAVQYRTPPHLFSSFRNCHFCCVNAGIIKCIIERESVIHSSFYSVCTSTISQRTPDVFRLCALENDDIFLKLSSIISKAANHPVIDFLAASMPAMCKNNGIYFLTNQIIVQQTIYILRHSFLCNTCQCKRVYHSAPIRIHKRASWVSFYNCLCSSAFSYGICAYYYYELFHFSSLLSPGNLHICRIIYYRTNGNMDQRAQQVTMLCPFLYYGPRPVNRAFRYFFWMVTVQEVEPSRPMRPVFPASRVTVRVLVPAS